MVDSVDELKSSRSIAGKNFRISKCWTRRSLQLWTRSYRTPTSRRRSISRNRKLRKRIGFCQRLHWFISHQSSWWWCSGIRCEMGWNSIIYDQDPTWWHPGKFVQIEDTWVWSTQNRIRIVWHGNLSEDIEAWLSKDVKTMVRRSIDQTLWLRNFDARHEKIETGAVVKSQKGLSGVEKGKGICYQWKEKEQCSKGDQCSFWHESNDRAKPTPKAAPTSEPQSPKHEVEVCREKETPEAEASLRSSIDRRVNTSWKVLAPNRSVSIGILPSVNSNLSHIL